MMPLTLREYARHVETIFADALGGGDLDSVEQECISFFESAASALNGELDDATIRAVRRTAACINLVTTCLNELKIKHRGITDTAIERTRSIYAQDSSEGGLSSPSSTAAHSTPFSLPASNPLDDPSTFIPYRDWFLAHFTHPYPTAQDKLSLLALVPCHRKEQLDTWFTNNRRRSGWQKLKREHAGDSADELERLLARIDSEEGGEEVEEEARQAVERVRAFFKDGAKDRVSEQIQAIVKRGAPTSATRRRVEARTQRGVGASSSSSFSSPTAAETRHAPYARPSTPPSRRRISAGDLAASPVEVSPLQAYGAARYPSTLASPASSTGHRSLSGSSASSLDSLVSYASTSSSFSAPPVPSSPPASSSLLSFDSGLRSTSTRSTARPTRRTAYAPPPPPMQSQEPHPYSCTLAELPTATAGLSLHLGDVFSAPSSSVAGTRFQQVDANGDLVV
ncbi:hypothetical protein JCM10207_006333 [Rhodosporidiobolus poonsookiae]